MSEWDDIVAGCSGIVWGTAWRLLGDHADASDCFQESFLAGLALSRTQAVRNWPGLMRRLAARKALDQLRKRKRSGARRADWADLPDGAPGPAARAASGELSEALREALAQLLPDQAEAFVLRHVEQLSYRQVAAAMGIKASAAGVLIHRGRRRLRDLLSSYRPGDDQPAIAWRCRNEPAPE